RIVDADDLEVCIGGHSDGDADQTARAQQAVRSPSPFDGGDIDIVVAVRAIHGAEDRVQAAARKEALLDVRGGDGHAIAGLVTGRAGSPVASHALEERAGKVNLSGGAVGARSAGGVGE